MGADELAFQDKAYYEERDIVVAEGPATELRVPADPDDAAQLCEVRVHRDNCSSEISLRAELVVLATGARAIHAAAGAKPAVIRQRITTLRSARDADVVRSYLSTGARVVILGGGLIGAEAASAAVEAGAQVTLVNRSAPAAASAFGEVAAREFERQHEDHGVRLVTSVSVGESVDGDEVTVTLASGEELIADLVIDAGGAAAADGLARAAGLSVAGDAAGGVLADAAGRTSSPHVLAIGDVARHVAPDGTPEPWTGHWEAAMHAAEDAAAALLGQNSEQRGAPWFWSDRYGHHIEAVGDPNAGEVSIERHDGRGLRAVFSCRPVVAGPGGGASGAVSAESTDPAPAVGQVVVLGAVTIDDSRLARAARRLVDRTKPVDAAALADPAISARDLLR
jgi:NADPH-dependent 2,4-dienoyl-CoA reductase/sulfur reductase-like enzyme